MKALLSAKAIIGFLTASSLMAVTGLVNDAQFNSPSFMQDDEIEFAKRLDDSSLVRQVASAQAVRPASQYLPVNLENKILINGEWEIRRIQNEEGFVVYDATATENSGDQVIMNFEMVGTSSVVIDESEDMEFDISYLDNSGRTIALFRSYGEGYEIIEAKRIIKSKQSESITEMKNDSENLPSQNESEVISHEIRDLKLERVIHPTKDANVLRGESITGSVTISGERIEDFSVVVGIGKKYRMELSISDSEIKAGGQFSAEIEGGVMVSGLVTNNGKEGVRIRFATGPLQGAMLNFVTEEAFVVIEEKEEEARYAREEQALEREETDLATQNVGQARGALINQDSRVEAEEIEEDFSEEDEVYEPETEEEFAVIIESEGYNFGTETTRIPASK